MRKPNARPVLWEDVVIAVSKDEIYYLSVEELEKFKVPEADLHSDDYAEIRHLLEQGAVTARVTQGGKNRYLYNTSALQHSLYMDVHHDGSEAKPAHWAYRKHLLMSGDGS